MKFSILIATYNQEQFISETISSCLNQNYSDFEVIVSDDCSSDATSKILDKFEHPKLIKYKQSINIGEYSNRNFLLSVAKGDFVIFIDGEDLIYNNALFQIDTYLKDFPDAHILIARYWDERFPYPKFINNELFAKYNFLGTGLVALNFTSLIFRKSTILSIGGFDRTDIKIGDLYIQLKIGLSFGVVLIPDGFSWWRRNKGQASETLLKNNFLYFKQLCLFWPQFINNTTLLSDSEKNIALQNFYGNILRFSLRNIFKFRFLQVVPFLRIIKIPFKFYLSIYKRPNFLYSQI